MCPNMEIINDLWFRKRANADLIFVEDFFKNYIYVYDVKISLEITHKLYLRLQCEIKSR